MQLVKKVQIGKGEGVIKKCEECGKDFSVEKNRREKARFCSQHCKGIWLAKHEKIQPPPVMTGTNHPRWKGGDLIKNAKCAEKNILLNEREKIQPGFVLRSVRDLVFEE